MAVVRPYEEVMYTLDANKVGLERALANQDFLKRKLGAAGTSMRLEDGDNTRYGIPFKGLEDNEKPDKDPVYIYYGPNYAAQRNALEAARNRNIPLQLNFFNEGLKDQDQALQNQQQQLDDNLGQVNDKYLKDLAAQNMMGDDIWYYNYQKFLNSRMSHNDASNGLSSRGSTEQRINDLYNKLHDQLNQTNLTNIKQGKFSASQDRTAAANNLINAWNSNLYSQYTTMRDYLRNAGASLVDDFNTYIGNMAQYDDRKYQDANGNLTQTGWDEGGKVGIRNDGNGAYTWDNSILGKDLWEQFGNWDGYWQNLLGQQRDLYLVDQMKNIRTPFETNKTWQDKSDVTRTSYRKATDNPLYYGQELGSRY